MNKTINEIRGVSADNRKKLRKAFNCTNATISNAFTGKRQSDLTKKIRHVALTQYSGYEVAPVKSLKNE